VTFTYQWERCSEEWTGLEEEGEEESFPFELNAPCEVIENATGLTLPLTSEDVGSTVRISITATNPLGGEVSASETTSVVEPGPEWFSEGETEVEETDEQEGTEGSSSEEFIPNDSDARPALSLASPAFTADELPSEPVGYIHLTRSKPKYTSAAHDNETGEVVGKWKNEAVFGRGKISPAELSWSFELSLAVQARSLNGLVSMIASTIKLPSRNPYRYGGGGKFGVPVDYLFHGRVHAFLGQEYQLAIKFNFPCAVDDQEGECLRTSLWDFKIDE
jgi:hypothetical protein